MEKKEYRIEAVETIELICASAADRKAEDIVILDMRQKSSLCEYFIVMSAPSSVRVKAIVDRIEESLEREGFRARHREGYADATWVLLDYGNVIVHVFYQATRKFYDLENLWGDAPKRSYWQAVS